MKRTIITLAALASFVPAVQAQQYSNYKILPNLYASMYCSLRQSGVSKQEAIDAAVAESMIKERVAYVTVNGKQIGSDVIIAAKAVRALCPEYYQ